MATIYDNAIQQLYVAYFNRPADPAGLAYWGGVVEAAKGDTAAVSAAFAASAEYKATYADFNTTGTLKAIYMNLFNEATPDVAGLAYWSDLVAKGTISIDKAVSAIAAGAQGVHKTTYANKVLAAAAFTTAVNTDAEKAAYSGTLANTAAKKFLAGITTDASLTAALVPATMDASVAAVVKASVAFTVAGALNTYAAATAAKAAFLVTADGDNNAATSASEADVAAKVTAAELAIQTATAAVGDTGVAGYVAATTAVKAALLADAVKARADDVTAKAALVKTATTAVETKGATALYANVKAADAAVAAAQRTDTATTAAQGVAESNFESLNGGVGITINADGTVTGLIVKNGTTLSIAPGVTETTKPGVTALLAAIQADLIANKSVADAITVQTRAHLALDFVDTDVAAGATTAMTNLKNGFGTVPATATVTLAQVDAEIGRLTAAVAAAKALVPADAAAVTAAEGALTTFNGLVTAFDAAAIINPTVAAQVAAEANLATSTAGVNVLNAEIVALTNAKAGVTSLTALNDAVKAATATFTENKFLAPVSLDGIVVATSGADILVAGTTNANVFSFAKGDVLFIGDKYTVNKGALSTGNDAVLEAFMSQTGLDTTITLETKAFGSNSADAEIVITLTGVNLADVTFANGIISI